MILTPTIQIFYNEWKKIEILIDKKKKKSITRENDKKFWQRKQKYDMYFRVLFLEILSFHTRKTSKITIQMNCLILIFTEEKP